MKKPFWLWRPSGQCDVWTPAAACLLLAGSVPVSRSFRARFVVPSAPAIHFSLPGAPSEAFTRTLQTVTEIPRPDAAANLLPQVVQERPNRRVVRPAKLAAAPARQPNH